MSEKYKIYVNEANAPLLKMMTGVMRGNDEDFSATANVNFIIMMVREFIKHTRLPLTANELVFCCDACNGSVMLADFSSPSDVNMDTGVRSMLQTIAEIIHTEPFMLKKHEVEKDSFFEKIKTINDGYPMMGFLLAIAIRHFWGGGKESLEDKKPLNECENYSEWASYWVAENE